MSPCSAILLGVRQNVIMDGDAGTPFSGPPPPLPKRKNAILCLFDAPLYRDGVFWLMTTWAVLEIVAIPTEGSSNNPLPVWLTMVIGVVFAVVMLGILPAWIRLRRRRARWQREQQPNSASQTSHAAAKPLIRLIGSSAARDRERLDRTAAAKPYVRQPNDKVGQEASPDLAEASRGLGITAANPALVGVGDDQPRPAEAASVSPQVRWDRIDADGFERLLVRLLEESGSYTQITHLMNVNASDAGRDIQAYRRVEDGLPSERHERTIVQAKHWPKRGVGPSEIADLVHAKLPLREGEPVRGLIVATTGSFTQDAVRWVDNHNQAAKRPDIYGRPANSKRFFASGLRSSVSSGSSTE
jgi:hypothetical protein